MMDKEQTIFRIHKNKDFTILPNVTLQDENLTWGARGLLAFLLSLPDDWTVYNKHLYKSSPAGRVATDRIMKELISAGYIERKRISGGRGEIRWITHIYESLILRQSINTTVDKYDIVKSSNIERTNAKQKTNFKKEIKREGAKKTAPVPTPKNHLAIDIYISEFAYNINRRVRPDIIAAVGDIPAELELWRDVVHNWKLHGYSPKNFSGMLDWFEQAKHGVVPWEYKPKGKGAKNGNTGGLSDAEWDAETRRFDEACAAKAIHVAMPALREDA